MKKHIREGLRAVRERLGAEAELAPGGKHLKALVTKGGVTVAVVVSCTPGCGEQADFLVQKARAALRARGVE